MGRLGNNRAPGMMEFWSIIDDLVIITPVAATQALPSVTVEGLPPVAEIYRVIAMVRSRTISDDSGSNNRLNLIGTEHIQVDKTGGTFIDAIQLVENSFRVNALDEQAGIELIGNIDIKSEVDGEDTYEFQWEGADVDFANLKFQDLRCGLRVYFTI